MATGLLQECLDWKVIWQVIKAFLDTFEKAEDYAMTIDGATAGTVKEVHWGTGGCKMVYTVGTTDVTLEAKPSAEHPEHMDVLVDGTRQPAARMKMAAHLVFHLPPVQADFIFEHVEVGGTPHRVTFICPK